MQQKTFYEQPLNERIRTLLRLEFLFDQAAAQLGGHSPWDSRAAVLTLLDLQSIFSRSDLKSELIKELERIAGALESWEENPNVDKKILNSLLADIESLIDRLYATEGQLGQELRQNELLNSVRQRSSIPGGTCDFDLPGYHFWVAQPAERRASDLEQWYGTFDVVTRAVRLILQLIRDSGSRSAETAEAGFFQCSLDQNSPCQMVRVAVPADCPYYAEISGGKHRFSIRFMEHKLFDRDTQTGVDVAFELACCSL